MEENTHKGQRHGAEVDKEEKGIHELKRGIRKTGMVQEEREQERENIGKNTICDFMPNLQS